MNSKQEEVRGNKRWLATLFMLMSALAFSCMQFAIKKSGVGETQPLMEQAFFRNLFCLVIAAPTIIKRRLKPFGDKAAQPYLFVRSMTGFLAILCFFYASNHAAIADVNVLNKLSPTIVMLLSVIMLHERVTGLQCLSFLVSLIGTWIVCGPAMNSEPFAIVAALMSAVFGGIAHTFVAALKNKAEPMVVIFHFSAFSVVCSAVGMIHNFVLPAPQQLCMLVLVGVFGAVGQITLTYSFKLAPASQVSIFNYSGIIWSTLIGAIFLGEPPKTETIAGGSLIAAASVIAMTSGAQYKKESCDEKQ